MSLDLGTTTAIPATDGVCLFSGSDESRFVSALGASSFCVFRSALAFLKGKLRVESQADPAKLSETVALVTKGGCTDSREFYADIGEDRLEQIKHLRCVDPRRVREEIYYKYKFVVVASNGKGSLPIIHQRNVVDAILGRLVTASEEEHASVLFVWRPPMAIGVFFHDGVFAIYDPRSRPEFGVQGAALYRFASKEECESHIRLIFPPTAVSSRTMRLRCPNCTHYFAPSQTEDADVNSDFNKIEITLMTYTDAWAVKKNLEQVPPPIRPDQVVQVARNPVASRAPARRPDPVPRPPPMSTSLMGMMFDPIDVAPPPIVVAAPPARSTRSTEGEGKGESALVRRLRARIAKLEGTLKRIRDATGGIL